ncbi:SpaA isopeptide-forming pilin-related protein [Ligilactobacillus apodemi]|uniref:SpaA isopeptide-forming pilin-related protein n=1 Tax=Ligilactobacillus apodemi TaxID=307126 RepID=UPI00214C72DE|nr:SpaA isopeptide-forming pilin-related protein [Ligilactobacillus apodemi]MCR1900418.1 SpaA isopeptide-forming pilin-related protein [Ligilactobacillus apodemi]
MKMFRKILTVIALICLIFPMFSPQTIIADSGLAPKYNSDDKGIYPAASWQPTGQENVINHQGGTSSGYDGNTSWNGDPSNLTNSYFNYGNASDPDYAIRQYARETSTPGVFDVYTNIKGNTIKQSKTLDLVFVVDRSASMNNDSRYSYIKKGISDFFTDIKKAGLENNVNVGLVTYTYSSLTTVELASAATNATKINSMLNDNSPTGGTNTQNGLHAAAPMLEKGSGDEKMIILLTDGEPTGSFRVKSAITENGTVYGTSFDYNHMDGDGTSTSISSYTVNGHSINTTWPATLGEARLIKNQGISLRALGINIANQYQANMQKLASPGHYESVTSAAGITNYLDSQTENIISSFSTISNGTATIPLGSQYEYVDANAATVKSVGSKTVGTAALPWIGGSGNTITLNGINLSKDEEIQLHYQVRLKTGTENFKPDYWYQISGTAVFKADDISDIKFGVPSGKASGTSIEVTKEWKTFSDDVTLPEDISFKVIRENATNGAWGEATGILTIADNWQKKFEKLTVGSSQVYLAKYDGFGNDYKYTVSEETAVDGFNTQIEHIGDNKWKIVNTQLGVQVEKRAAESQDKLSGAEFKLVKYTDDFVTEDPDFSQKLSGNSKDITGNITNGNYALIETKAPTGYELDQTPLKFSVKDGKFYDEAGQEITTTKGEQDKDGFYLNLSNENAYILTGVKVDTLKAFELTLKKTDTEGNSLSGAEFELTNDQGEVIAFEYADEAKTKLNFKDLKPGTYTLTETKAPADYHLLEDPIKFTITAKGEIEFEKQPTDLKVTLAKDDTDTNQIEFAVENTAMQTGSVTVKKYNQNKEELANAKFELIRYTDEWQTIDESFTKQIVANTEEVLSELKSGHYALREITAPTGYELDETLVKFKWEDEKWFDENGEEITASTPTAKNQLYLASEGSADLFIARENTLKDTTLTIKKINGYTQKELAGAEFTVTDANGNAYEVVSSTDGIFTVKDLKPGSYTLKETKAPEGYVKLTEDINFTITASGTVEADKNADFTLTDDGQNTLTLTIKNYPAGLLPKTGGQGILLYAIVGLILIILSGSGITVFRKRKGV